MKKVLGEITRTPRKFEVIKFRDRNDEKCSLQMSSIADNPFPGTSAVWLGCDDANPQIFIPGRGWKPIIMPSYYLANTRMHLSRPQVEALILHLQSWLEHGSFEKPDKVKRRKL